MKHAIVKLLELMTRHTARNGKHSKAAAAARELENMGIAPQVARKLAI